MTELQYLLPPEVWKRVTCLRSLESCSDWCYCTDKSVAHAGVIFLEHRLGVSAIDRHDFCGLKSLNAAQDQVEVPLYHHRCFSMALLNDI